MDYPRPEVKLIGEDGNAFFILAKVEAALRKARVPKDYIEKYRKEAMSGNYNNLLVVTSKYVEII